MTSPLKDRAPSSRVHFVGIGGAGMSAIAKVLIERGGEVSGSDLKRSRVATMLEAMGAKVHIGHDPSLVEGAASVVVSAAIPEGNPEYRRAKELGIEIVTRGAALAQILEGTRSIVIAGTHGKTTTTSMVTTVLGHAEMDPTYLIGAGLNDIGTNARAGSSDIAVAEADESDGSFLLLSPYVAVVTNIELDHVDHWSSIGELQEAFEAFVGSGPENGWVVIPADGSSLIALATRSPRSVVTFGDGGDVRASEISFVPGGTRFTLGWDAESVLVELRVPGLHNIWNATTAAAACRAIGCSLEQVAVGLAAYRGVERRFQVRGTHGGVTVIDDYAHHPTEVKATLAAARNEPYERIVVVFQPHRYSRTAALAGEFGASFDDADHVVLMDVYGAGELPVPGVSGRSIADAIAAAGGRSVEYFPHREGLVDHLIEVSRPGDALLTLGAGDVTTVGEELHRAIGAGVIDLAAVARDLEGLLEGKVATGVDLASFTTYRVGGPAAVFVEPAGPADLEALGRILRGIDLGDGGVPVMPLGRGSNTVISEHGFPGIVIRLGPGFAGIETWDPPELTSAGAVAGAAASLPQFANWAARRGLTGLEWAIAIPGSVGGGVRMNAGAHGGEMKDVIVSVRIWKLERMVLEERPVEELDYGYRHCNLTDLDLVVEARFGLQPDDVDAIRARMESYRRHRAQTQPGALQNAGSVFRNPPGDSAGRLVESAGLKGFRVGGAMVSELHANFFIAGEGATPQDVRDLVIEVRRRVAEVHGVELVPEIRFVGEFDR